jgi:hypothetical protein
MLTTSMLLQLQVQQLRQLADQLQLRVDAPAPGSTPFDVMHHPCATPRNPRVDAMGSGQLPTRADALSDLGAPSTAAAAAPAETVNAAGGPERSPAGDAGSLDAVWAHLDVLRRRIASSKENSRIAGNSAYM